MEILVYGHYVYPPVKKTPRAQRLLRQYFSKTEYLWGVLHKHGSEVFEQDLTPEYVASLDSCLFVRPQQQEMLHTKQLLVENLKKQQKAF